MLIFIAKESNYSYWFIKLTFVFNNLTDQFHLSIVVLVFILLICFLQWSCALCNVFFKLLIFKTWIWTFTAILLLPIIMIVNIILLFFLFNINLKSLLFVNIVCRYIACNDLYLFIFLLSQTAIISLFWFTSSEYLFLKDKIHYIINSFIFLNFIFFVVLISRTHLWILENKINYIIHFLWIKFY
jgi:hypothetical protein